MSLVLSLVAVSFVVAVTAARLPPAHHPPLDPEFAAQLHCPYAQQWLTQGPEQAARELGLRQLQQPDASGMMCGIAPGPIGAAHQAAFSSGYLADCPDTPGESSPYQWPLAWSARSETKAMAFGSDEVKFHSMGQVYYRLDKNWKRQDTVMQRGIQRAIGQGPCLPENVVDQNGPIVSCRRDSDQRTTMIHRGHKMFFITWLNGTSVDDDDPRNIDSCTWLDLKVIGNIRPDWFMDARGESTDTQYLGDQHLLYNGNPRLVKQWRKTDFANQYFTMSMLVNTNDTNSNIHWPLILNIPGEGFGDDFLRVYTNHSVLTDSDNDLFLLDESLQAIGRNCTQRPGSGTVGPPTSEADHVPSNLEIDPHAWFSNEYTFSPVWEPPPREESDCANETNPNDRAVMRAESAVIESCYDTTSGQVELIVTWQNVEADLPWMALGYRQDEECLMTPRGGGDSEIIVIRTDENSVVPTAFHGWLTPAAKSFDRTAVTFMEDNLVPLNETTGFSNVQVKVIPNKAVSLARSDDNQVSVQLHFQQSFETAPDTMHLMYAIGSSPELGYHATRHCFQVDAFPPCPTTPTTSTQEETSGGTILLAVWVWSLMILGCMV